MEHQASVQPLEEKETLKCRGTAHWKHADQHAILLLSHVHITCTLTLVALAEWLQYLAIQYHELCNCEKLMGSPGDEDSYATAMRKGESPLEKPSHGIS